MRNYKLPTLTRRRKISGAAIVAIVAGAGPKGSRPSPRAMTLFRVIENDPAAGARVVERHDVTHRRELERLRLREILELAYPDRSRFTIETVGAVHNQDG